MFSIALIVTCAFLVFANEATQRLWIRMAAIYGIFFSLVILLTPQTTSAFSPFQRDVVSLWFSIGFVVASLALIAYLSFRAKKRLG